MVGDHLTKLQVINTTFSFSQSTQRSGISPVITASATVSGVFSIIAVFGNLFNIIFIWRTPALHNLNNFIIMNLSFVDFLNGLIVLPMVIILMTTGEPHYPVCQFQGFMLFWLYAASLTTSSAIAFDRLYAILYPYRYDSNVTVKKFTIILTCIWFIPTIIATLPILGLQKFGLGKYRYLDFCSASFTFYNDNYVVCWILTIFITACITSILFIYAVIFFIAYRKTTQDLTGGSNLKKSIRTTALIVGTNLLCWLPFVIISYKTYINTFHSPIVDSATSLNGVADPAKVLTVTIVFSNAAVNPIIYMATNSYLRKHLILLFYNNPAHGFS